MPRNAAGVYTLPLPPVIPNTVIESDWANATMDDIAATLQDSLSRSGQGGMLGSFRVVDGNVATPGLAFVAETSSGLYRISSGDIGMSVLGVLKQEWTNNGIVVYGTSMLNGNVTVTGTVAVTGGITGGVTVDALTVTGDASVGGKLTTSASTTVRAGFMLTPGVAPTTPVNGDLWLTATQLVARINGATRAMAMLSVAQSFSALQTFTAGVTFGDAAADPVTFVSNTVTVPAGGLTFTGGPITVPSLVTSAITGPLTITGALTVSSITGPFTATGGQTLNGGTTIGGILTVTGVANLNGGTVLGDAAGDALTINSTVAAVPSAGLSLNGFAALTGLALGKATAPNNMLDIVATPTSTQITSILLHNAQSVITTNISVTSTAYSGPGSAIVGGSSVVFGAGQGAANFFIGNYLAGTGFVAFMTNAAERMRITPEGNVGIGMTPPLYASAKNLSINDATNSVLDMAVGGVRIATLSALTTSTIFGNISNTALAIWTNGLQRMVIEATGKIGINGVSSASGQVQLSHATADTGLAIVSAVDGPGVSLLCQRAGVTGGSVTFRLVATVAGSITHPTLTTTAYNTSSDARLKHHIRPVGDVGRIIDNIPVVSFDWKTDGAHVPVGLIAQDVHGLFPGAVHVGGTDVDEDPWMIDPAKLVPVLLREIQCLRERMTAVEKVTLH